MRTLRAATMAAKRWLFVFSQAVLWLTRVAAACILWTTLVFGASFTTVALYFPEDALTPQRVPETSPLSAYARWSALADDGEDEEVWLACLADRDCVERVCSTDSEHEEMQTAGQIVGVAARP
jgi:hypothetical protein